MLWEASGVSLVWILVHQLVEAAEDLWVPHG